MTIMLVEDRTYTDAFSHVDRAETAFKIGVLSDMPIRDNRSTGPIVDLHLQAVLHQFVPRRFSRCPAVQILPFVYGLRVQSTRAKHLRSPIALRPAKRLYHACTQVGAIELPCYPRRIVYTVRCKRIKIPGKEVPDRLVFLEQSGGTRPDRRVRLQRVRKVLPIPLRKS